MQTPSNPENDLERLLEQAHLRYINRYAHGIKRQTKGKGFIYKDQKGEEVKDEKTLQRIQALVLPPAWTDVWICPYANGHLQATGIDAAGRKQYRYHNRWLNLRNLNKFDSLVEFGKSIPKLRRQLRIDLKRRSMDKTKACAIAISIIDHVFMRVGNSAYEEKYGSYGLTTLKSNHLRIKGPDCFFRFKGKKGVQQNLSLHSKELVRLLKKIKEIPGQALFQYYNDTGEILHLESGDVNEYLKIHMGQDFTCKDFRTWAGTVLAFNLMFEALHEENLRPTQHALHQKTNSILDQVAAALGNTRAVTKKYYVHPSLLQSFESAGFETAVTTIRQCNLKSNYKTGERELLRFMGKLANK